MTTICPMLSALPPVDDSGQSVNRECIYEGCRFFDTTQRDCGLMMASRAMVRMAREAAERPAATTTGAPGATPADLERPLNEVRRDLLNVTLETQGVVREAGQAAVTRITDLESRLAEMDEALARALDDRDARLISTMREMLRERPEGPAADPTLLREITTRLDALAARLESVPTPDPAAATMPAAPSPELIASLQDMSTRLDTVAAHLASPPPPPASPELTAALQDVQGHLQELPARMAEQMPSIDGLAGRLDQQATRLQALEGRLEETAGAILSRLDQSERDAAARETERGALEAERDRGATERDHAAAASLQTQERGLAEVTAGLAQIAPQLGALQELQSRVAETLLEEMSLVAANARKLEQAMIGLDQKMDRSTNEAMQLSQLVTLVKGETERTYAGLRSINEGNRAVIEAIETQLQRDQSDLKRRRQEEAMACNNRGVALYYRGALDAALDALRQAVKANPEYAEAYNNLGLVLSRLDRGEEATEAFQHALKIDPRLGEAYNNLGFLYHTAAQFDRAVKMFDQAIQNAADSSVAYANLGNTFYKMKQSEKAVEAWRRALDLDPMNEHARRGLRMFQQDASSN
jgi:Tfp pilus assembly protein PilF